jgi:hypothetical protein
MALPTNPLLPLPRGLMNRNVARTFDKASFKTCVYTVACGGWRKLGRNRRMSDDVHGVPMLGNFKFRLLKHFPMEMDPTSAR